MPKQRRCFSHPPIDLKWRSLLEQRWVSEIEITCHEWFAHIRAHFGEKERMTVSLRVWGAVTAVMLVISVTTPLAGATSDLVIIRDVPSASGLIGQDFSYSLTIYNGGPGSADGSRVVESLGGDFGIRSITCRGTTGGASCPAMTWTSGGNGVELSGAIMTLPAGGTVVIDIDANLPSTDGSFVLTGSLINADSETRDSTNVAETEMFARPVVADLAVTHSDPLTGGAHGVGGRVGDHLTVVNGDTLPADFPFPREQVFRIVNNGPDPVPSALFEYRFGKESTYAPVTNALLDAAGFAELDTVPMPTRFSCTAAGSVHCPAGGHVWAAMFGGTKIWFDHEPQTMIIGNVRRIPVSELELAQPNPLFGQTLQSGDAITLSSTVTQPVLLPQSEQVWQFLEAFTPTASLFNDCRALNTFAGGYLDHFLSLRGAIIDPNTANNEEQSNVDISRSCTDTDVSLAASMSTSNGDAVITSGESFTTTFVIRNEGAGIAGGLNNISANWPNQLNWAGSDLGTIDCSASDPVNSPCPSAVMLSQDDWPTPLGPGDQWVLSRTDTAGMATDCDAFYHVGWVGAGIEFRGLTNGSSEPLWGGANNYSFTNLNAVIGVVCPGSPAFDLSVVKTGPYLSASDNTTVAQIPEGARAFFKIEIVNSSLNGVEVRHALVNDRLPYPALASPAGYVPEVTDGYLGPGPSDPPGFEIASTDGGVSPVASGIICEAFGSATCPASSDRIYSTELTAAGRYNSFFASIPYLPPIAGGPNADPNARVVLTVPFQQPSVILSSNAGTVSACLEGATDYRVRNIVDVGAAGSGVGELPMSIITTALGVELPPSRWEETVYSNNLGEAQFATVKPSCSAGGSSPAGPQT